MKAHSFFFADNTNRLSHIIISLKCLVTLEHRIVTIWK